MRKGRCGIMGRRAGCICWRRAVAHSNTNTRIEEGREEALLPSRGMQEALLARYFTYVHPSFPVVHKLAVLEGLRWRESSTSPDARRTCTPPLLLLAMYALAARYEDDAFLDRAKTLLDASYAASRPSTCQALLLMGYREIGIGAMAQAWIYIGMAVRMAQDLGMQRDADGWVRAGVRDGGGTLFCGTEIAERRRIWYACVIMDKYVSTYIGALVSLFSGGVSADLCGVKRPPAGDFRARFRYVVAERERSGGDGTVGPARRGRRARSPRGACPRPGRVISCFNASANLSGILSQIVQAIYAIRPASSRHGELVVLDGLLEKWHLALPEHLRYDPAAKHASPTPFPHILTLHMQYWCAVLLLHRPFIRHGSLGKNKHPTPDDGSSEGRGSAEKSYELCAGAANHMTTIATVYSEKYSLKHCAVFLCYYIFTASIMHVTTLSAYPTDPQARVGLTKCMDALRAMEIVWPSAARALELLRNSQANLEAADGAALAATPPHKRMHKRSATQPLDDAFERPKHSADDYLTLRAQNYAPSAYAANGHYAHHHHAPLDVEGPGGRSPYYQQPPAYDRWPAEAGGMGALAFQGALSTSVMGPAYSTGLVDERHRAHHHGDATEPHYPQQQYWSDYAAFPQLGTTYGGLPDQATLAVHPAEPQMYHQLPEQYNMYTHQ
ncbi:fungal-specific transcription factor domain-containing protein [Mycena sp. CBHHK59/15]|nr:fungal-specific transcription factor domain-containing protein [Mycena sp. CBHHK59/15]